MVKSIKNTLTRAAAAAVLAVGLAGISTSAEAAHWGGGHWGGGPRFSVGIGIGPCCWGGPYWAGYSPYYYDHYYDPYPYRYHYVYHSYDVESPLASPYVQQALVAPVGEPVMWSRGNASGSVTTTRDGWAGDKYCREFVQNTSTASGDREVRGTACQANGGAWQMVANQP